MRTALLILIIISSAATTAFSAEIPAASKTAFSAVVSSQARINVDGQGTILSVFNTTDGSGNKPTILNVYCGETKITITPAIQANLDKLSPNLDWKKGGVIYTLQIAGGLLSERPPQRTALDSEIQCQHRVVLLGPTLTKL